MSVHRDTESDTPAEGFADRWSRRKQAVAESQTESAQADVAHADVDTPPPASLTDEDMPPLETLDKDSDYAAFLSPGVSEALRTRALRKLFQLPGLSVPDGLDDYDDDFTRFAGLGKTITHEMRRMLERQLQDTETPAHSEPDEEAVARDPVEVRANDDNDEDAELRRPDSGAPESPAGDENGQGRA